MSDLLVMQIAQFDQALCAQTDPDIFFPGKGENFKVVTAKKLCAQCTHKVECLEFALAGNDDYGVFGGLSAQERKALRGERHQTKRGNDIHELKDLGMSNVDIAFKLGIQLASVERSLSIRESKVA
jgi:WhiB family redox-sensing transcriptional regulator